MDFAKLISELRDRGLTLGAAESFTCGLFASKIGEVPGASAVFKGSVVSYGGEVKEAVLGVKPLTLRTYGPVSQQTAIEMAVNGKKILGVDVCVSFTGNAGPTADKGNAKVGEAFICIATAKQNIVLHPIFDGERNAIREKAANMAAEYLIEMLEKGTIGQF